MEGYNSFFIIVDVIFLPQKAASRFSSGINVNVSLIFIILILK